jgi:hypothetical protein
MGLATRVQSVDDGVAVWGGARTAGREGDLDVDDKEGMGRRHGSSSGTKPAFFIDASSHVVSSGCCQGDRRR